MPGKIGNDTWSDGQYLARPGTGVGNHLNLTDTYVVQAGDYLDEISVAVMLADRADDAVAVAVFDVSLGAAGATPVWVGTIPITAVDPDDAFVRHIGLALGAYVGKTLAVAVASYPSGGLASYTIPQFNAGGTLSESAWVPSAAFPNPWAQSGVQTWRPQVWATVIAGADSTAPSITAGPTVANLSLAGFDVRSTWDENCEVSLLVTAPGAAQPSDAEFDASSEKATATAGEQVTIHHNG